MTGSLPNLRLPHHRLPIRQIVDHHLFWPAAVLVGLLVINLVTQGVGFFDISVQGGRLSGSPINILRGAAPLLLVAIGMTLVIALKGIDLSVGAVFAISAAVACSYIQGSPNLAALPVTIIAIGMALGVALLIGAWNGVMVGWFGIQPIVATLILMVTGRGIAQLITSGQVARIPDDSPYVELGRGSVLTVPTSILIAAAVLVGVLLLTRRTALGMLLESVGGNAEASRLAGIRARGLKILVYAACGLCAGMAGLIVSANLASADSNNGGLWIELDAILAVVIGGTLLTGGRFFLMGTLLGVLVIQTLSITIINVGLPSQAQFTAKAVVVVAVALLQSSALRSRLRSRLRPRRGPAGGVPDQRPREEVAAP
jgi:galactofuranose transport system permease protein